MARVTGPLMSFDASGTIASAAVFSKWRGRNYVRRHAVPNNPRTAAQLAARAIVKFLGSEWAGLSAPNKATWLAGGDARKISAFNQFISINARNWRDLLAPSKGYPAARALSAAEVDNINAVTSGRQIKVSGTTDGTANVWAVVVGRSLLTGEADSIAAAVAIVLAPAGAWEFVDGPLDPGTYYYQAMAISTDGKISAWFAQVSAVVS